MKTKILFFAVISSLYFLSIISYAQAPAWLWAKSAGGTYDDWASSVAVDDSGNAYVAGKFYSPTITFGSTTLTNAGGCDIFLAKYDANGNVLWAKSAGGTDYDQAYSVAVDASGNTYVAGNFNSPTITFGYTTLTNTGGYNIFLTKYDANGNVIWAKSAGGTGGTVNTSPYDVVNYVTVDASEDIYATGWFAGSTLTLGSITLTGDSAGYPVIFLAKYAPNGDVLWAKSAVETGNTGANSIAADTSENIYMAGDFYSPTITFGSFTLTNAGMGNADIFLVKYNTNGNVLWAKSAGGMGFDAANSVAADASGNIYLAGYFGGTITFGSTTFTSTGQGDIFLVKYDTNGNVQWAKKAGGINNDLAKSVALDATGNIYVTGEFMSPTLNFNSITLTNASVGTADIFLTKYDANGNVLWAKSAGGTVNDRASSVAADASGNIYVAGWFNSYTLSFGSDTLTNADDADDIFIAKLGIAAGINELSNLQNISVYPNPSTDKITIIIPCLAGRQAQKSAIEILNIEGQIIKSISADLPAGRQGENLTTIDISGFASGMYFVKVKTEKDVAIQKFVKK